MTCRERNLYAGNSSCVIVSLTKLLITDIFLVKMIVASVAFFRYTSRVSDLMGVLKDLSKGKYQRTMVSSQSKGENAKQGMVSQ